ncbi:MAG: MBL fold metallo-hydrolase [Anaerolineales bacterium]|nr:MBL fold metallo-hydrolase [Anaerolineales bacterium]
MMRIVSLIDNIRSPDHPELSVEHGISIAILMDDGHSILFDSGQSDAFLRNARLLGVDIAGIDAAVFSHHHYDHCGGIAAFIKENITAPLYLRPIPEGRCVSWTEGRPLKNAGIKKEIFTQHTERFVFVNQLSEILPGVFIITDISRGHPLPRGNRHLFLEKDGERWNDPFEHELFMVIKRDMKLIVFSGCSHRGIQNILDTTLQSFPDMPIECLVGGFHLIDSSAANKMGGSRQEIQNLGKALLEYPVKQYYTGHCTGIKAFDLLKAVMGDRLAYFATGDQITI